ncbi:MAG: hypothetical protein NC483_06825 [Ruminococcus sp.]|nr:hypothetical protein [Ruminococcus sp.]
MKLLNEYGYTKFEILVIVLLLGVVAFITINKTSYAFAIDSKDAVKDITKMIELQAEDYAMDNLNLFDETNTTYINVSDLIDNNYLIGNSEGLVINPTDSSKNFNENKVKLEYDKENNKVEATFID